MSAGGGSLQSSMVVVLITRVEILSIYSYGLGCIYRSS